MHMSSEMMSGRSKDLVLLSDDFVPGSNHVICAKGKQVKEHPANRFLKSLIKAHLSEYNECPSKLERSFIVSKILKTIQQDGEGGFVRQIDGKWFDIGPRNSKEKIGQSFRDNLHTKYRSSTRSKANIRKRLQMSDDSSSSRDTEAKRHSWSASPPQAKRSALGFPIAEVAFDRSAPAPEVSRSQTDLDWRDLEPLPISEAMIFPQSEKLHYSSSTASSAANSFESAMTEARSQMSCSVLSSTTAPSMDTSCFGTFLQQHSTNQNQTADQRQQHQSLLASLQAQAMSQMMMIPEPDPIREPTPAATRSSVSSFSSNACTTNTAPISAAAAMQDQFLISSLQAPSAVRSNLSTPFPAYSNPSCISTPLLQQHQQFPLLQQQLLQEQNQEQTVANPRSSTAEDEFVQAYLKSQQGQWKHQFD